MSQSLEEGPPKRTRRVESSSLSLSQHGRRSTSSSVGETVSPSPKQPKRKWTGPPAAAASAGSSSRSSPRRKKRKVSSTPPSGPSSSSSTPRQRKKRWSGAEPKSHPVPVKDVGEDGKRNDDDETFVATDDPEWKTLEEADLIGSAIISSGEYIEERGMPEQRYT